MTFDHDLKETLEQMQKERAVDQRYREAFDTEADLEWMMTPQVDLAAERARDRITPSQPSREVRRQAGSSWAFYALCAAALFMALIIATWLASYSSSVVNVMLEQVETKGAW